MADEHPVPAGVVGLGLMGTSITTCLLAAGHRVVAIDKDAARRRNLKRRVSVLLVLSTETQLWHPYVALMRLRSSSASSADNPVLRHYSVHM
jgi:3-hydroxyacyl-CoA dehydrogenase